MPKPTDDYLWAESAVAEDISDPSVERPGGFKFKQDLPNNQFNHLIRSHGRWLDWLIDHGGAYTSLDEFIQETTPGQTGLVAVDPGFAPGTQIHAASLAAGFDFVATDGLYVVASTGTSVNRYSRDLATVDAITLSNSPTTIRSVRIAHGLIAVVYDTYVDVFDADDLGSPVFAYDRGVAVHDVAITPTHLVTVGAQAGSGEEVFTFETNGFTLDWSYDHGAGNTVFAVCADGDLVYIGGNVSASDSATVRALKVATGAVAWSVATPGAIVQNGVLATNGAYVFVEGASALEKLSRLDGAVLLTTTALSTSHIETDGRFLFATASGEIKYWDLLTMSLSDDPAAIYSQAGAVVSIDTDGGRLFAAGDLSSGAGLRSIANPTLTDRRFRRGGNAFGCLPSQRAFWPLDQ